MNFKMYQFERLEEKSFRLVHFKTLYLSPTHMDLFSTFGGINRYKTGVTIRESSVELIKPPINTQASGE